MYCFFQISSSSEQQIRGKNLFGLFIIRSVFDANSINFQTWFNPWKKNERWDMSLTSRHNISVYIIHIVDCVYYVFGIISSVLTRNTFHCCFYFSLCQCCGSRLSSNYDPSTTTEMIDGHSCFTISFAAVICLLFHLFIIFVFVIPIRFIFIISHT